MARSSQAAQLNPFWSQLGGDLEGEIDGDLLGEAVAMSADGKTVIIGAREVCLPERSQCVSTGRQHFFGETQQEGCDIKVA